MNTACVGVATNQAYPVIIRWDLKLFQYLIEAGQGKSLKEEKTKSVDRKIEEPREWLGWGGMVT